MESEEERLISVQIANILTYKDPQYPFSPPESFIVLLKGQEEKVVPISIGDFEGRALAMAKQGIPFSRPLTHNLLHNLLAQLQAQVHCLVIHTLKEDTFFAYLSMQTAEQSFSLDCRPSDGMVLATLMRVPIYVTTAVMQEAGRVLEASDMGEDGAPEPVERAQFEQAAALELVREKLRGTGRNELEKLKAQLDRLVAEEAYEEAAKLRDQISQMESQA